MHQRVLPVNAEWFLLHFTGALHQERSQRVLSLDETILWKATSPTASMLLPFLDLDYPKQSAFTTSLLINWAAVPNTSGSRVLVRGPEQLLLTDQSLLRWHCSLSGDVLGAGRVWHGGREALSKCYRYESVRPG
jgi:hypothetical protein